MVTTTAGRQIGTIASCGFDFVRNRTPYNQKNTLKPWQQEMWCIPEASAEYVACMEDVLDLYEQSYDPSRPVICYDEWRRNLIGETRASLPAKPGMHKRIDYEYWRNGVAYLHMLFEPLVGKRHILVSAQHTIDFQEFP